jgi:hypothetical protein
VKKKKKKKNTHTHNIPHGWLWRDPQLSMKETHGGWLWVGHRRDFFYFFFFLRAYWYFHFSPGLLAKLTETPNGGRLSEREH